MINFHLSIIYISSITKEIPSFFTSPRISPPKPRVAVINYPSHTTIIYTYNMLYIVEIIIKHPSFFTLLNLPIKVYIIPGIAWLPYAITFTFIRTIYPNRIPIDISNIDQITRNIFPYSLMTLSFI